MAQLSPEKVIEIAEQLSEVNLFISVQKIDSPKLEGKSYLSSFENQVLKDLLSDNKSFVKEYVFKPRHREFIVRLNEEGKVFIGSYASRKESEEIIDQIGRILNGSMLPTGGKGTNV